MGELAVVSFAARLCRVGEEGALGEVRVLAFVTARARAMFGKVDAEVFGAALAAAFRGRATVDRGLARWAGIATGGPLRISFVVASTIARAVGVAELGSSTFVAGAFGAKHRGAAS